MNGRKPISLGPYSFSVTKMGYRNPHINHDFSCVVLSYSASIIWVTSVYKVHAVVKLHATIYYAIILSMLSNTSTTRRSGINGGDLTSKNLILHQLGNNQWSNLHVVWLEYSLGK